MLILATISSHPMPSMIMNLMLLHLDHISSPNKATSTPSINMFLEFGVDTKRIILLLCCSY